MVHSTTNNVEALKNGATVQQFSNQSGNSVVPKQLWPTVQIGSSGWGLYTASGGTGQFGSTSLGSAAATGFGILTVSGSAIVNAGAIDARRVN